MIATEHKILRVTRQNPCPICGKSDWCGVSADGTRAFCMRVESKEKAKNDAWIHDLTGSARRPLPPPKPKARPAPIKDFVEYACRCVEQIQNIDRLAKSLGLSARSLERLQVGWNGQGYTFPMRDGCERIIGVRVRTDKGKWSVPGSHNGLFWPEGIHAGGDGSLVITEGASDCAAALDLGFEAIGRPSCLGCVEYIVEFLGSKRCEVVIVSDHDEAKQRPDGSTWRPGQEGAARLAQVIRPFVKTLKIVKPPFHKDLRDWLKAGATRAIVKAVISNTRFQ